MLVPLMNATFMRRLTSCAVRETTRKRAPRLLVVLAAAALAAGGCATRGPLHVYAVAQERGEPPIVDRRDEVTTEVPSFLGPDDVLTGFAYDPFTDHFFLRLAPGNLIRVVDRPARAIKREFTIPELTTGGDLTALPRSGHLFFLDGTGGTVIQTSRLGKTITRFALQSVSQPAGLAVDPVQDQLIALHAEGGQISFHDLRGQHLRTTPLSHRATGSLAYDAERQELYAPLRDQPGAVGVFSPAGKLLRQMPFTAPFIDVGPRSFVRVF